MSDQNHNAIIQQGRAMVRLIEAADALLPAANERESRCLHDRQTWYRQRLRQMMAELPVEVSAQILAAFEHISGPIGDTTLN